MEKSLHDIRNNLKTRDRFVPFSSVVLRVPMHPPYRVLRRVAFTTALVLVLLFPGPANGRPPEDLGRRSGMGGEIACYSRYVSRGIAFSDGPVLQPSAWAAFDDFSLSFFGNYLLTDENERGRFNEADFSLSWNREWEDFTIEPSLSLYTYPNTTDATQYETGLILAYDLDPWMLSAFNSVTFARGEKASYYGELALSHTLDLSDELSFTTELAFSWPSPALTIEGKFSYELTDNLSLFFHAGYGVAKSNIAKYDDHDAENEDDIPQGSNIFFGLGLGFSF
jgi:hypothetical protein